MDDDIAELLAITTAIEPAPLDVTTQEWLAAHDGWVRVLEDAGYSREVATVLVQRWALMAEQARLDWEHFAAQCRDLMAATATALQPIMDTMRRLGVQIEQTEAPPLRRCPSHGELMTKGGSCRRCQFGRGQWARAAERRHQQLHRVRR